MIGFVIRMIGVDPGSLSRYLGCIWDLAGICLQMSSCLTTSLRNIITSSPFIWFLYKIIIVSLYIKYHSTCLFSIYKQFNFYLSRM